MGECQPQKQIQHASSPKMDCGIENGDLHTKSHHYAAEEERGRGGGGEKKEEEEEKGRRRRRGGGGELRCVPTMSNEAVAAVCFKPTLQCTPT